MPNGIDVFDDAMEKGAGDFQGDIILTEEQKKIISGEIGVKAFAEFANRWLKTGNVVKVPYTIESGFSSNERAYITRAMTEYRQKTCIRLQFLQNILFLSFNISFGYFIYLIFLFIISSGLYQKLMKKTSFT